MKATLNGIDIGYDDHGIGQPVIFLHAFPLNRSMWEGQLLALLNAHGFRGVALDLRGFGESGIDADVSTMEQFADDVAALMDALGMQDAILCGLSMGGYVTFAFLRKYPQRVRGLILCDTKPDADSDEGKANREKIAQLVETQGQNAVADVQVPKLLSTYTRQHHVAVEERVRQIIAASTKQGIAAASRGMALRRDAHDLLATIRCPTLVVVGEQDSLTPPQVAQLYAEDIQNARFVVVPYAGHLSNLEQPEAFFEVIYTFLRSSF